MLKFRQQVGRCMVHVCRHMVGRCMIHVCRHMIGPCMIYLGTCMVFEVYECQTKSTILTTLLPKQKNRHKTVCEQKTVKLLASDELLTERERERGREREVISTLNFNPSNKKQKSSPSKIGNRFWIKFQIKNLFQSIKTFYKSLIPL